MCSWCEAQACKYESKCHKIHNLQHCSDKDNDCGIGFNIEQTQFMVFSRCELIQDLLKALLVHLVSLLK